MSSHEQSIKEPALLHAVPTEALETYRRNGTFRTIAYKKDTVIHFEGEVCRSLEIILTGHIGVEHIEPSGNLMNVAEFFAGDILGGSLMFSQNPHYPMTVTTRRSAVILEINKDDLFLMFCHHPAFLKTFLTIIADRTALLGDRISHYARRSIRECIINYLRYESARQHSDIVHLGVSKKVLAERIGVQRTSLSRELAKMKKANLIDFDAASITILSHDILT